MIRLNQPTKIRLSICLIFIGLWLYPSAYGQSEEKDNTPYYKIDSLINNDDFEAAIALIDSADFLNNKKIQLSERLELQLLQARAKYGLEDTEGAMKLLLEGFDESTQNIALKEISFEYANLIGSYLANSGDFDKSNTYYKKALNEKSDQKNKDQNARIYLAIGRNYFDKRELDSAEMAFEKVTVLSDSTTNKDLIAIVYTSLGIVANTRQEFDIAEKYFEDALIIRESLKDTVDIAGGLMNLGSFYFATEKYEEAYDKYKQVLEITENLEGEGAIRVKEDALYNLAYSSNGLGRHKEAFAFLDQANVLTDSLSNISIKRDISEIEAKYNVAKEAQKLEEEKSKRQRAQFLNYGIGLTSLAIMLIGYIFSRNYRLKQRSKIEKIENESHTKIINATIDAKEKERKSIAETLHDSVSALLSSANLHLQATRSQLKREVPQEVGKAQKIINEASVKIRDLSHELISSVLLKFGLAFAINDVCQKYSNSEISLHSDDKGIKRYDQDFEIKIYNIIEEMINNILKHSKATNATIMLEHKANDKLSIRISDDGVGFDPLKVKQKDGLGLSHINARIRVMKGVFNIDSARGKGTSIFIEVPVMKKRSA